MDSKEQAALLLDKYLTGRCTEAEKILVERFYLEQYQHNDLPRNTSKPADLKLAMWQNIMTHKNPGSIKAVRSLWPRIVAAASIIIVLCLGSYFLIRQNQTQHAPAFAKNDIAPGHNQATLTLANGQKIILTRAISGKLAQQGNTRIAVNNHNALAYTTAGVATNAPITYNTLSTARGEQSPFPLVLADGTKVWLNAMSSITFPTAFTGKERTVTVTGEAYFEVIHNSLHPFKVLANGQTIEDIGTHFNVNAYGDEPVMKTTLIEGIIKVSIPDAPSPIQRAGVKLKPGQQTLALPGNSGIAIIGIKDADIAETIAWVDGKFRFNDQNMQAIMRQLGRWYHMDVQFEGNITNDGFNGQISRYKNISQVLNMLQSTNLVHFKVEGRRVTVMQ